MPERDDFTQEIETYDEFISTIATAGTTDIKDRAPEIIRAKLWDGRVLKGIVYEGYKAPNIVSKDVFLDEETVRPYAEALIEQGKSFITQTGRGKHQVTIEWDIWLS